MPTRRTFLSGLAGVSAAVLATPGAVWPISLWRRQPDQVQAALGSKQGIIEMLTESADPADPDSIRPLIDLILAHDNTSFRPCPQLLRTSSKRSSVGRRSIIDTDVTLEYRSRFS